MRACVSAACLFVIGLGARDALGHRTDLSQSDFVLQSSGAVRATLVLARADAARIPILPSADAGLFSKTPVSDPLLLDAVAVRSDGRSCQPLRADTQFVDDAVQLMVDFACQVPARALQVEIPLLRLLPPGHRHAARITAPRGSSDALLTPTSCSFLHTFPPEGEYAVEPSPCPAFLAAVRLGAAHILTGWDHLLFLFALLLGLRGTRAIFAAASAFTVGHSITLAVAAFSVAVPTSRIVEPAIAASIAYVAFENLRAPPSRHRWPIAFAFGLVHGFGFAGALRVLTVARERLLPTLFGFNVGVEFGQALVVALTLPLVALALRGSARGQARGRLTSVLVGLAGVVICFARILAP